MPLKIAAEENPNKNECRRLVEAYLKNVVREMHHIDAIARNMHKEPNRAVEVHAARQYMLKNPLHVSDKAEALAVIGEMERESKKHVSQASFKTKMDYKLGSIGKTRAKAAIVAGAAAAVGGVAIANGASPETGAVISAALGLTYLAVGHLAPRKRDPEKREKRLRDLLNYTRAKQTLFVLKAMEKRLKKPDSPKPRRAVDKTAAMTFAMQRKVNTTTAYY